ncbi:transposable element Tcb1 transposase [Trichonephila clavipes]|nr:transposable element Tcb1 transposase [Trichonephila clavipes]
MSRRKQRSAFDQVSEFDRERIVAYPDCGLSFREIVSARTIRRRLQQSGLSGRRPLLDAEPQTSPPPMISLLHFSSTHCRYFKQPALHLRGVGASCPSLPSGLAHSHISTDNARLHVTSIDQRFSVNLQIELLPWPALSPDLSLIENMWPMVAQRMTQITPPAAKPDQIWQRGEAAWSAVPQNTSKVSLNQCRGVWQR